MGLDTDALRAAESLLAAVAETEEGARSSPGMDVRRAASVWAGGLNPLTLFRGWEDITIVHDQASPPATLTRASSPEPSTLPSRRLIRSAWHPPRSAVWPAPETHSSVFHLDLESCFAGIDCPSNLTRNPTTHHNDQHKMSKEVRTEAAVQEEPTPAEAAAEEEDVEDPKEKLEQGPWNDDLCLFTGSGP